MKLLFLGDIVGRSGRDAVCDWLPKARAEHGIDCAIVNAENAAGGFGMTPAICADLFAAGADVITSGNHVWDQQDIIPALSSDKRILRPHNYPPGTPGSGATLAQTKSGKKVLVMHVQGQIFMHESLGCPFAACDEVLKTYTLGANVDAIVIDIHAEANSEKYAMGHYFDGRVSLVVGTHTHVPTNDAHILKGGTAYQTDAGMCGDYDSCIGMKKETVLKRFTSKITKGNRMEAAMGEATLCGVIVETDDKTGLAKTIQPVKVGGVL